MMCYVWREASTERKIGIKGKKGRKGTKKSLSYCALLLACATPTNHKRQASARMNEGFEDETDTHTQQHKQH